MIAFLYPKFLEQEDQYTAVEQFWHALFAELAAEAGQVGQWKPWRPRAYENGLPFERDGNPIFDAINKRSAKAVQVIQWASEHDAVQVTAWISNLFLEEEDEATPIFELTLNLTLSEESVVISKHLLRMWLNDNVDAEEMSRLINEQLPDNIL